MNKPKFNVGDEVRVEFVGKIMGAKLTEGRVCYEVDSWATQTYANRVLADQMTLLETPQVSNV
jgi:hypothetical protein